ncbi:acyl-CoA dehydrogenase family protein [Amycolatopsis jejuensis]|uniref:acyl-CoA dehydrogenase family protein n=1 Tax=Amycolatopsis jejuensis TaxID=330084 RepID=UPI00068DB8CB|nr:acyl-CoA dehydrogenase family protein [Amycolatopsis jejuensis]
MDADVTAEFRAWLDANWSAGLTVREWWRRLADSGWSFPQWPEEAGGRGESPRMARVARTELANRKLIGPPDGIAVTMLAPTLLQHASPAQQRELLPQIARGEIAACQLFSEPGAGSDLAGLRTSARPDGGDWVVNGQKVWSSLAHEADWGMLLARTDPEAPKHRGISYLLVPLAQPGVEVRPLRQMNGLTEFNEVFLTEARVPGDRLVGQLNDGWRVAQATLAAERSRVPSAVPAPPAGQRGGWLDRTVGEAAEALRTAASTATRMYSRSGRAARRLALQYDVWSDDVVRDNVVQLHILSEASRALMARLRASPFDGGASVAKLAAAALARRARDVDLDVLGPAGLLSGPDAALGGEVELMALSAHLVSIGGGTDEIQKNVLAERVLGLPRE